MTVQATPSRPREISFPADTRVGPLLFAMKTETQAEKRKSISELHRSRYKRNSISKNAEESRRRRLAIDQALRRKHREQLITAKRFRHLTQQEEYESAGEDDG